MARLSLMLLVVLTLTNFVSGWMHASVIAGLMQAGITVPLFFISSWMVGFKL